MSRCEMCICYNLTAPAPFCKCPCHDKRDENGTSTAPAPGVEEKGSGE